MPRRGSHAELPRALDHDLGAMLAGQAEQGLLAQPQRLLGPVGFQQAPGLAASEWRCPGMRLTPLLRGLARLPRADRSC